MSWTKWEKVAGLVAAVSLLIFGSAVIWTLDRRQQARDEVQERILAMREEIIAHLEENYPPPELLRTVEDHEKRLDALEGKQDGE